MNYGMCISVFCALRLLRRTYYVISRNPEYGRQAYSKMLLIQQKIHRWVYYYVHFLTSEYLKPLQSG